jgi:hypothetical protein
VVGDLAQRLLEVGVEQAVPVAGDEVLERVENARYDFLDVRVVGKMRRSSCLNMSTHDGTGATMS